MRQRRWLIGIVVLLLATGVPVSGLWAQAKPAKVTIGYQVIPNNEIIAKANGWHEKEMGVKIDWKQFDSGRDASTSAWSAQAPRRPASRRAFRTR